MNKKNAYSLLTCLVAILGIQPANSATQSNTEKQGGLALSLGYLGGEAKEYVYNGDNKLSELTWKTSNAAIIKANASYPILTWLDINFSGWSTLASGSGSQSDQDWRDPDPDPENDSLNSISHSSTTLNHANMFDVGLTGWLYQNEWARLGVLAGYKESRFSWTASGGYFEDFDDPTNNEKFNGSVIGYKQTYKTPYIGAIAHFYLDKFAFKTEFKYSSWVKAEGYDNHYLRPGFITTDKASSAEMYSVSQEVAYNISPSFQVVAEAAWNKYKNHRTNTSGTTERDKNGAQESFYTPGGGGLSSYDYTLSAGVRYTF
ncbi:omptin family outer membrane protease [Serratia sp. AKBS12]|uniref:omptin family outer membrane protease n=1 Tax=Serratia sp. AKBS12 TaxID=2974597 RepID=UPI002165FBD6|nr:omptin family outer membrane protease [Serratia sp. AKBS12]MCS3407820.1 omptin family outer membrane protease [Serratia sp. AKBS12]HEI8866486.1 omptin family outer membrane protease [Serratia odorifera]